MSSPSRNAAIVGWLIGPAFMVIAAWLALASPSAEIPIGEVRVVPREEFPRSAFRAPLTDAKNAKVGAMNHSCSECHKLFTESPVEKRVLVQHKDIVINHGMNTRCMNCHFGTDRDKLVLHDGTLVGFEETPRLCSQCHGTVYRDWQKGMHGKTLGSWDPQNEAHRRLTCNECHDPHAPAYTPMAPLPGPETLRMGEQPTEREGHGHKHSPLSTWSRPKGEHDEKKEGDH